MGRQTLTRKMFMTQCAAGLSALVLGCGDDGGDDTGASSTGNTTGGGPTSASSMSSDPSDGSTSEEDTSGGSDTSGGPEEGSSSSSGGTSGSDSGGMTTTGGENACGKATISALISLNHGHTLEVPLADIEAGIEQSYDCTGSATHCHQVTLTEEDFATLRAGGVVTKFTCNGGDHEYVLSCAADPPKPGDPAADCVADPAVGTCP